MFFGVLLKVTRFYTFTVINLHKHFQEKCFFIFFTKSYKFVYIFSINVIKNFLTKVSLTSLLRNLHSKLSSFDFLSKVTSVYILYVRNLLKKLVPKVFLKQFINSSRFCYISNHKFTQEFTAKNVFKNFTKSYKVLYICSPKLTQ